MTGPRTPLSVVGGTRKRRHVTRPRRQKLATVMAVEMSTLTEVAEQTGIPKQTIHEWLKREEFGQVRTRTREDMAEEVRVAAFLAVERLVALLPTMEGRDVVFALEKTADLMQLLTGHATDRVETRDLTKGMAPAVLDELSDEIDEWLAARRKEKAQA